MCQVRLVGWLVEGVALLYEVVSGQGTFPFCYISSLIKASVNFQRYIEPHEVKRMKMFRLEGPAAEKITFFVFSVSLLIE